MYRRSMERGYDLWNDPTLFFKKSSSFYIFI